MSSRDRLRNQSYLCKQNPSIAEYISASHDKNNLPIGNGITGNIPLTDNTLPVNQSNLPIISGGSIIASNSPVINLSGTGIVPNTIAAVPPGTTTATSIVAPATVVGSGITRLQPLHSMSEVWTVQSIVEVRNHRFNIIELTTSP
ncbi:unnamed protein product [Trichobilharzia regenti]|nr:unnamed protein product [Trichobilharzia regenti]